MFFGFGAGFGFFLGFFVLFWGGGVYLRDGELSTGKCFIRVGFGTTLKLMVLYKVLLQWKIFLFSREAKKSQASWRFKEKYDGR